MYCNSNNETPVEYIVDHTLYHLRYQSENNLRCQSENKTVTYLTYFKSDRIIYKAK